MKLRDLQLPVLQLLMRWGIKPHGITCTGKTDGGGAQMHAKISVIAFCSAHHIKYFHTPIQKIRHGSNDCSAQQWEDTFDFKSNYELAENSAIPVMSVFRFAVSPDRWFFKTIVKLRFAHVYTDANPSSYVGVLETLRSGFKYKKLKTTPNTINIVAHIRRGDVSNATHPNRYTSDDKLIATLALIKNILTENNVPHSFTVVSEGCINDFQKYADWGCNVVLDGNTLDDLQRLVQADILITAKSEFSFTAALLNSNLIIHEPFWHPAKSHWVNIENLEDVKQSLALMAQQIKRAKN